MTSRDLIWRLTAPPMVDGDAVGVALGLDQAKLRYGPWSFDFENTRLPSGDVVLTLTPEGGGAEPVGMLGRHERVVFRAPADLPPGERRSFEAKCVRTLGRTLFDDVARLVRLEMEYR